MKNIFNYIITIIGAISIYISILSCSNNVKSGDLENESLTVNTVEGLRNLIKSTTWSFEGYDRNIMFEFDTDSTFKRNVSGTDGTRASQIGHYKILPAKYSNSNKPFYYVDATCGQLTVSSGAVFSCHRHYYLVPDSTTRLYDPSGESSLQTYGDEATSFKFLDDRDKIRGIGIEDNKNGYKQTGDIDFYPNVLGFFPNSNK